MDDTTILGATLGQLGQTAKKTGQRIVRLPEEISKDLGGQIGAVKQSEQKPAASAQGSSEPKQWKSDEERVKFLRDLYGSAEQNPSETKKDNSQPLQNKKPSEFQEQIKDKSPEEQKKLLELRNQLHKENYYDSTFNPVKKQEERPAEKVEEEKKVEMQELQQKEAKKPPPLAVVRERNKTETFRGAAG